MVYCQTIWKHAFYFNDILLSILLSCLGLLEKLSLPLQGISLTPLALFAVSLGILILFLPKGILPKHGECSVVYLSLL